MKLLENINVHPGHIESCHRIKFNTEPKKVIIKTSRRKDAVKIRRAKKGLDLSWIVINSAVFINDSLCWYYKNPCAKCKKLWLNKFIHSFRTSNGSIRLKRTEPGNVCVLHMMPILKSVFQAMSWLVTIHVKFHASLFCILLGFNSFPENIVRLRFIINFFYVELLSFLYQNYQRNFRFFY